jgi:hypothetical protein
MVGPSPTWHAGAPSPRPEPALTAPPRTPRLTALLLAALVPLLAAGSAAGQAATPGRGRGAEGPGSRALPPPDAEAPPLLEARVPGDAQRAARELDEAAVLDALTIRALRAGAEQLSATPPSCAQALAARRAAELAWAEVAARVQTADALLAGRDAGEALASRHAAVAGRVGDLPPRIDALSARVRRLCSEQGAAAPRLWLPPEARVPADGRVAIFVSLGVPGRVLWVDGEPRSWSGSDGWAVAVTRPGSVSLCVAAPAEPACRPPAEVYAVMGAAFELGGD